MKFEQFANQFIAVSRESKLWQHPYFALIESKPTLSMLKLWATQAGMIDQLFAEILQLLLDNPAIAKSAHGAIAENRDDELGHGNPSEEHFQLFQGVLSHLGVSLEVHEAASPLPGTEVILTGLRNATKGADPIRALAIMASEELICPQEFPLLVSAMSKLSLPRRGDWQNYFAVHCEADVRHSHDLLVHLYNATKGEQALLERAFACQHEDINWNCLFYESLLFHGPI